MKKIRKIAATVLAMVMAFSASMTAMAAEYTTVDDISFSITHDIEIDGYDCEVYVHETSNEYEVDSVKVTNEPDLVWEDGDKPKITIVLWVSDEEKYRFASGLKKADIGLSEEEGKVTSVSRGDSGRKLTIKVELPKLERAEGFYEAALAIEDIDLDESSGIGYWEENEYANRYELRFFRNGSYIAGPFKTTNTEYDFSKYFTRRGTYTFKVRGIRTNTIAGDWCESDEVDVDSEDAADIREYGGYGNTYSGNSPTANSGNNSGSTQNTQTTQNTSGPGSKAEPSKGSWFQNEYGWWWCNPDRTYPANAWKEINGAWYYFNQAGYCVMNTWIKSQDGSTWYFCGDTGAMVTNVWVMSGSNWYYCGPDGAMWTSRRTPDGYYVDSNGAWIQ